MNSILDRVKYVSVAVFSSAIVLFALTNLNTVEVRVIAWRFEAGVSLLILVPFLAGLLIGLWTGLLRRHGKAKKAKAQDEAPEVPLIEAAAEVSAQPEATGSAQAAGEEPAGE